MFNKEPVWDRIIRTLNKKRRWLSPSEVHVSSPPQNPLWNEGKESMINGSNDNWEENLSDTLI